MYVEITAQTRFSDFSLNGCLHFSKCLMYFEKARFAVAKDAGLREALSIAYPGKNVQFWVAKTDIRYFSPVPVSYDGSNDLAVRSWIKEPFISSLTFEQELTDIRTETPFIRAKLEIAMVILDEGLIRIMHTSIRQCLEDYLGKLRNGPRFLCA